ncbi:fimbrillin-A associated anchor protein Mfa1/Mfa2 [Bacteroides zoogleoformans]|uniref:Fimbrillin-A associated anchor protein Mfa1/Mfa2 n=1 Tax=Bacteroides zoogleoformans TaxID=28119 RepID=A0ABN5IL59_9BACE|nr:FimB/Mfa2 family fimbrial subunit [Bacteroides zoogleoformans]AVM53501.1 hypothetical protein C4H11_11665 [Bacteroides zoogleoformans]TWJ17434.1 fimbrillin-A associated anchor protein Mfa1/Mfa2 [Bacteroides zoogleoformans]
MSMVRNSHRYPFLRLQAVIFLLALAGCIGEDRGGCPGILVIEPHYLLHDKGANDRFGEEVHRLELHLFGESGTYLSTMTDNGPHYSNGQRFEVELPEGVFHVLAVGGAAEAYETGTYDSKAPEGFSSGLHRGVSTLDDFRIRMRKSTGGTEAAHHADSLFFGRLDAGHASTDNYDPQPVYLTKNTKRITLRIRGIAANADARLYADNERIGARNERPADTRPICYTPYETSTGADNLAIRCFRTSRLYTDGQLTLQLLEAGTGKAAPGFSFDLTERLRSVPGYATQEGLDRTDHFVIDLTISGKGTLISLRVNGWETVPVVPEV